MVRSDLYGTYVEWPVRQPTSTLSLAIGQYGDFATGFGLGFICGVVVLTICLIGTRWHR